MRHKPNPNPLELITVKLIALGMTAQLAVLVLWKLCLIVSGIMTFFLCMAFHANAPVTFLGSVFGFFALALLASPFKAVRRSHLITVCQEQGFWEMADDLVFQDAGSALDDILAGRQPKEDSAEITLALCSAETIFTRRGDNAKALKVAEYLYDKERRERLDGDMLPYQAASLAAMYICSGRYLEGINLLQTYLASLHANERDNSPASTTVLLGLTHAYIDLHKFDDAKECLSKLKDKIDAVDKDQQSSDVDRLVRAMVPNVKIDQVFYFAYLGKLLMESGEKDADIPLKSARDLMSDQELQKKVTLLFPEILLHSAFTESYRGNFVAAEQYINDSIKHYELETRYKGPEYLRARALQVYVRVKLKKGERNTEELEETLQKLRPELEPNHPYIATCLVQLAQSCFEDGNAEGARRLLAEALQIRQALYPANDPQIAAVTNLLETSSA